MKKRLQIILNDESWSAVHLLSKEANKGFDSGHINYSDAINEMILTSNVNIKELRKKHTDLRRSLKSLASKEDLTVEAVMKCLQELKSITSKKQQISSKPDVPSHG